MEPVLEGNFRRKSSSDCRISVRMRLSTRRVQKVSEGCRSQEMTTCTDVVSPNDAEKGIAFPKGSNMTARQSLIFKEKDDFTVTFAYAGSDP